MQKAFGSGHHRNANCCSQTLAQSFARSGLAMSHAFAIVALQHMARRCMSFTMHRNMLTDHAAAQSRDCQSQQWHFVVCMHVVVFLVSPFCMPCRHKLSSRSSLQQRASGLRPSPACSNPPGGSLSSRAACLSHPSSSTQAA